MSWLKWLQKMGLSEPAPAPAGAGAASTQRAMVRTSRSRRSGEAYSKEWVKVLEDNDQQPDPDDTYTWELYEEATQIQPGRPDRIPTRSRPAVADPDATRTMELQPGGDADEDPWGVKKGKPGIIAASKDGVNPYDTGLFDATWTGRFDQR